MSLLTDLRAVSESAVDQLAGRFADLPRPLLAAIGAGDIAVERLAELRESLKSSLPTPPQAGDVRSMAGDLPGRAQRIAEEVTHSLEHFAAEAPGKAQELMGELPGKLTELGQALTTTSVRETVEAYTQLAGVIYGNLAQRGDKTWGKARSAGLAPGTVVDEAVTKASAAADGAAAAARRAPRTPRPAATSPTSAPTPTPAAAPRAARPSAPKVDAVPTRSPRTAKAPAAGVSSSGRPSGTKAAGRPAGGATTAARGKSKS